MLAGAAWGGWSLIRLLAALPLTNSGGTDSWSHVLLALLASWSGMPEVKDDITAQDLVGRFDLNRLPREPVVFDPATARL